MVEGPLKQPNGVLPRDLRRHCRQRSVFAFSFSRSPPFPVYHRPRMLRPRPAGQSPQALRCRGWDVRQCSSSSRELLPWVPLADPVKPFGVVECIEADKYRLPRFHVLTRLFTYCFLPQSFKTFAHSSVKDSWVYTGTYVHTQPCYTRTYTINLQFKVCKEWGRKEI